MAGKQAAVKTGVWTRLSYADGEALNKLSQVFIGVVNDYRNNPTPETESNMNFHGKSFKDAWKAVK